MMTLIQSAIILWIIWYAWDTSEYKRRQRYWAEWAEENARVCKEIQKRCEKELEKYK